MANSCPLWYLWVIFIMHAWKIISSCMLIKINVNIFIEKISTCFYKIVVTYSSNKLKLYLIYRQNLKNRKVKIYFDLSMKDIQTLSWCFLSVHFPAQILQPPKKDEKMKTNWNLLGSASLFGFHVPEDLPSGIAAYFQCRAVWRIYET